MKNKNRVINQKAFSEINKPIWYVVDEKGKPMSKKYRMNKTADDERKRLEKLWNKELFLERDNSLREKENIIK